MSGLPRDIPFTKVPNILLDDWMSELPGSEFKVALTICRKTFGYHKRKDGIAISQIMDLTGLAKNTVLKALKSLVNQNVIQKRTTSTPYQYCIKIENGSKKVPSGVQKMNRSGVQKMNPQKKELKETERNTTSSSDLSEEILEVINAWNRHFPGTARSTDSRLIKEIEKTFNIFTVKEINKAIFNRKHCRYYREHKPQLLNKPSAFFPYPETIANDLERDPENIFDYEERNERICNGLNKDEDFKLMPNYKDEQGRPLWRLAV